MLKASKQPAYGVSWDSTQFLPVLDREKSQGSISEVK
jgi:hypothetical protein